jgi:hypothetical protein
MAIHQPRQNRLALNVDNPRSRSFLLEYIGVGSDGDDAIASHGDRLSDMKSRIDGHNFGVMKDEVRRLRVDGYNA